MLYLTSEELNNYVSAELEKTRSPVEQLPLPREPETCERSPRTIIRERRAAYFSRMSETNLPEPVSRINVSDRRLVVLSDRDSIAEARVEVYPQDPSIPARNLMPVRVPTL